MPCFHLNCNGACCSIVIGPASLSYCAGTVSASNTSYSSVSTALNDVVASNMEDVDTEN